MKKIIKLLLILCLVSLCACQNNQEEESSRVEDMASQRILIAYFSLVNQVSENADAVTYVTPYIGNSESVALEIQKQVGGDLFLIETEKSYPTNHQEASQIAEEEKNNDERPVLSTHLDNIDSYDMVFIGYPIWWYEEPMVIHSFIEEYDLQDKTVIPFCTSLGVSITESENNLRTMLPESNVLTGLSIRTESEDIELTIQDWLKEIGVISNEDNI